MNQRFLIRLLLIVIIVSGNTLLLFAQNKAARSLIVQQTDTTKLNKLSKEYKTIYFKEKARAAEWAKKKNIPLRYETKNGRTVELQRIDERGRPIYYITHNKDAAATTSTNKLHEGEDNIFQVSGQDMIAGIWDGGVVLTKHREFSENGISRVLQNDGAQTLSDHATHVAGTIAAKGIDPAAKGMAFKSTVHSHDWNNDLSEMSGAAAAGLLLSNHSYGTATGWSWNGSSWEWVGDESISQTEDYRFGFYTSSARSYDVIAHNAPYYLIVKSAGNDRGDGPSDAGASIDGGYDGYDCISSAGNAKNILTVGATADMPNGYTGNPEDVRITSFSSFGPSDDGRIKPDICGNGQGLYSCSMEGEDAYTSKNGTSMSAPNVTGSLLLLQEYYFRETGNYMKAATLKALVIHTASEAGSAPGPDYKFGWGLLNAESAAKLISHNGCDAFISEHSYEGNTMSLDFYSDGTKPLTFTIVWPDPPGNSPEASLDPRDKILVNDLNIKAINNQEEFFPYILDVENPHTAAATGVNNVDNVEKIYIETPAAGLYTLEISHAGSISDESQDFSLIVSGISSNCAASLETDSIGYSAVNISWKSNVNNDPVLLAASTDNIFGAPEDGISYAPEELLQGGGQVLYFNNTAKEFLHENLRASNSYFYKAWVQQEDGTYTPGIPAMYKLPSGTPKNLTASNSQVGSIELNWELNNRQHDILLAKSEDGVFGIPKDGTLHTEGTIEGGGIIIASGNFTQHTDTNLEHDAEYHYKIWSFIDDSYYSEGDTTTGATKPLPKIDGEIEGADKVYIGATERYRVSKTEGVEYKWQFPEGWTAEGTDNVIYAIVGNNSGEITVSAVENGYEGPAKSLKAEILAPKEGRMSDYGINLFPNPSRGNFKLSFAENYETVSIKVSDVSGREVFKGNYEEPVVISLYFSELQAGTYFIELNLNNTDKTNTYFIII
jgi:hypothetical protein